MSAARRAACWAAVVATLVAWTSANGADEAPKVTASVTGFYYAMRDEPDFALAVATLDRGAFRLEARHNYEARHATSTFVGWKFSGGETVTFEVTPIAGVLFGSVHAVVPGIEASVAYQAFDAYIEAEYVSDRDHHEDSFFYAWSELGYRPVEWLRLGLIGQRTRVVHNDRDLQRGIFAQLNFGKATLGIYAINPDAGSRYTILSAGIRF